MLDPEVTREIEDQRPPVDPERLSRQERERLIERGMHTLYRWYVARSQKNRNWNPDFSFNWRELRKDHTPEVLRILEGFYAVEQFAPDYTTESVLLLRRSYGRAQFSMRWGSEEEKHSDLWRNTLVFSGHRSERWLEEYTLNLREGTWKKPFPTILHNLIYTVIQERATQVNYLRLGELVRESNVHRDGVLAEVCHTIAVDEAAHHHFFLEAARLHLYYFPQETLTALVEVLEHFRMPAADVVPDYEGFIRPLYDLRVFSPVIYVREVVKQCLGGLGIENLKRVQQGVRASRQVPDPEGSMRDTALFDGVDFQIVEGSVLRLFTRLRGYEEELGLPDPISLHRVRHVW